MNLKASLQNSYDLLADKACQNQASWAVFRVVRSLRLLHELLAPHRFFEKTIVVADAANKRRASFSIWGNESSLWYLLRCFEGSGLSVVEESAAESSEPKSSAVWGGLSSLPPSISFVWHNRALSSKFRRRGFMVLPGQVRSRVDLSCGMEAVRSKFLRSAKAAVRSIQERGLRYHVFPCDGLLQQFYDEMYLPYRKVRFHGNPIVKDFELVRDFAKGSVMLAVTESTVSAQPKLSDALGALIIRRTGAFATPDMPGVSGDPTAALERGVIEALYYFSLDWCHGQGVQSVDLGQSHPFLDDGVLRFKSKWGASVEASETGLHNLAVKFLDNGWLGKHFLENHPPIVYGNQQLVRQSRATAEPQTCPPKPGDGGTANLIGLAYLSPDDLSHRSLRRLRRSRMIEGLRELVVVSDPESADSMAAARCAPDTQSATSRRGAACCALNTQSVTSGEGGASTAPTSQMPTVRFLPCYDLRYLVRLVNSL